MATWIPEKKISETTTEEVKLPWDVIADPPTIPSKTSQLTNDSGFTANKGTVTSVTINGVNKTPNSAGLVDLGVISGGGSNVEFINPMINGNGYQLFADDENGYFTGAFRTSVVEGTSFDVNINDGTNSGKGCSFKVYTRNQTEVIYELTVYRANNRIFAKITILGNGDAYTGATPNNKSDYDLDYGTLSSYDVIVSTTLSSSYQEESYGFLARGVI